MTIGVLPSSFVTITVPRPSELPAAARVEFVVESTGAMSVLGSMRGTLEGTGPGSVLLTVSVPRQARAGIVAVARVLFSAPGAPPADVSVNVDVQPTPVVELRVADHASFAPRGHRVALDYTVENRGNRAEAIQVEAIAPAGWRLREAPRTTGTLGVNQVEQRTLNVDIPISADPGQAVVRLVASIAGQPVATTEVGFVVVTERPSSRNGPVVASHVVFGDGRYGRATAAAIDLAGPIAPGISISGYVSTATPGAALANSALHRIGHSPRPPFLRLDGGTWNVDLGYAGYRFSELAGSTLSGSGAAAAFEAGAWKVSALVASPGSGVARDNRDGLLAGATVETDGGPVHISATGARHRETGWETRELDAFALGTALPLGSGGLVSAEVAQRRSGGVTALGWITELRHRSSRGSLDARVVHAPGGHTAFAQAARQAHLNLSRVLSGRLAVRAGAWSSRDDATRTFSRTGNDGWSAGANVRLAESVDLGVGARRSGFLAVGSAGVLGSFDEAIELNLSARRGALSVHGSSSLGTTRRETSGSDATATLIEEGERFTMDGAVAARGAPGSLSLFGRYERSGAGSGLLPMRAEVGLRAMHVPLTRSTRRIVASAELRRAFWPGFGAPRTMVMGTLDVPFLAGLTLQMAAERNPFLLTSRGVTAWEYGVRVRHETRLPMIFRALSAGVVYQDLNGNGLRDRNEPGRAGVVILAGRERAVSRDDGTFAVPSLSSTVRLDPLSLEHGWIEGLIKSAGGRHQIAIVPVSQVALTLRLMDGDGDDAATAIPRAVIVVARDARNRAWVARRGAGGAAFFDALPPGDYRVEVNLSDVNPPLLVDGALPAFTVSSGGASTPLMVILRPRPMQIRRLGPPPPPPS